MGFLSAQLILSGALLQVESVSIHPQDLYRTGISIAFANRSFDLSARLRDLYRAHYPFA